MIITFMNFETFRKKFENENQKYYQILEILKKLKKKYLN